MLREQEMQEKRKFMLDIGLSSRPRINLISSNSMGIITPNTESEPMLFFLPQFGLTHPIRLNKPTPLYTVPMHLHKSLLINRLVT